MSQTEQGKTPFEELGYYKQKAVGEKFAEYLRYGSLYQKHRFEVLPDDLAQIRPEMVHLYCPNCRRENPFRMPSFRSKAQHEADIGRGDGLYQTPDTAHKNGLESRVYAIALECAGCTYEQYTFWVEFDKSEKWARKVGQLPQPSIAVPRDLAEALGEDVELYKRAKICLNQAYGVAACACLRRVLENRITPLLEIIRSRREEEGADEAELEELDEVIGGKVASSKIELAGDVLPPSLKFDGDNALYLLYDELSFGIHSGDEDGCVEIAARALSSLDYVLVELGTERKKREARKGFRENLKRIRGEKTARERGLGGDGRAS